MDRPRTAPKPEATASTSLAQSIQILGLVVLSVGAALIYIPAGVAIFGAGLIFAGTTMELS